MRRDLSRVEDLKQAHEAVSNLIQEYTPAPFDYAELEPDVAKEVFAAAERIKSGLKEVQKTFIDVGRDLLAAKTRLPHGQFEPWVEAELQLSLRTAQRFMSIARAFDESKSAIVALLPLTVAEKIAARSTPSEVREDTIARAAAGEKVTPRAVELRIKAAKLARQVASAEAALRPRERRKLEQNMKRQRADRDDGESALKERQARIEEAVDLIANKLADDLAPYLDILSQIGPRLNETIRKLTVAAQSGVPSLMSTEEGVEGGVDTNALTASCHGPEDSALDHATTWLPIDDAPAGEAACAEVAEV